MTAPKLRFDGFDSDWTLDSIGAVISNKSKKYDPEKSEIDFPCIELEHLSQQTGEILGTVSAKDQKSIKNVFDENSVLFGKLRPYLRKFAKPKFQGVCSSEIWVLTSKKMQPNFLFQYVQTDGFSELTQIQAGSKMPRADWGSISNGEILFPIFEEQTKIASFLSAVDEKINQLTQKHQLLSQYKQGMMQKLFSQQIRFKAHDGSEFGGWEEKKLGSVCQRNYQGINTVADKVEYQQHGYPILQAKHMTSEKLDFEDVRYLSDSDYEKYKDKYIPQLNDILFSNIGTIGKVVLVDESKSFFIAWNIFLMSIKLRVANPSYITAYLRWLTSLNYFDNLQTGNATKFINKTDLLDTKVNLPCLEEQSKIANFLSAIDQKINVVSGQIEQAKLWKKGLLQQMFV